MTLTKGLCENSSPVIFRRLKKDTVFLCAHCYLVFSFSESRRFILRVLLYILKTIWLSYEIKIVLMNYVIFFISKIFLALIRRII